MSRRRRKCGISLPALPRGRERPIRGWQQGNTGTQNPHSFYGKLADVGQALKKGDNIYIDGRLEQRKFIGCDDSKPRTAHEIVSQVSRDRARPVREQSGGIGRRKERGRWITQCGSGG